ncbi:hypothetical protein F2P81_002341 [Scophthalmus maximus]|uniref:FAD-binding PCMH-type domain-containing protein n=1 Tax=Scophthalmus maximus TaxID=52904 RepID=A0A6A4TUX8_SCOMX|nr:hypothetical protein F2P81_002341 [Scophthalmus maximus]
MEKRHYTVNACLQPIVTLHGAAVVTVEGVGSTRTKLHPVQERIAKAHGTQCGFCTPGMVMSMYTLLRNKPRPTMEDIKEALCGDNNQRLVDGLQTDADEIVNVNIYLHWMSLKEENFSIRYNMAWNICRCTGYRPIIDGFKTFCGREIMEKKFSGDALHFQGQRVSLVAPSELLHLLELKAEHPSAPLTVGNTTIGPKRLLKGVHHPLVVYVGRISELRAVTWGENGLTVGAACSLSALKEELEKAVAEMEEERARAYRLILQTLQCLAGKQIRNMAASIKVNIGNEAMFSQHGMRDIHMNEKLFPDFGKTSLRPNEVLLSIDIPYSKPWESVAWYRQAQRREFAFAIVNAGMKVAVREGTDIVESLNVYYGGVGSTLVKCGRTCQQLVGRRWGEDLLTDACRFIKEDVDVSLSIHGGRAEYRKTLAISFFFKFYMQVALEMRERGVSDVDLPLEYLSALKPFKNEVPQGQQSYQLVSEAQPSADPVGHPSMHQSAFQQATGEAKYYDDLPPVKGELFIFMVICVGQIICAVVAESREQARRAAETVQITYQDLQPVFFTIQEVVGTALGIASNKITCHVKRLGGGFGGKVMKIASLSAITAVAAHKTGRAVRCCLERGDDMLITSGRHPFLGKYKVGYNRDGTIIAADIIYYSNGGCTLDESSFIMDKAVLHMDNGYKIPNLRGRGVVCKTYLPSYTAFRGFGGPQGLTVIESVLHEVAVRCGLPPEKVRGHRDVAQGCFRF